MLYTMSIMSKEIVTITPEGIEIANAYLTMGNIEGVCMQLSIPKDKVAEILNKREVKKYIDTVYLDTGYRNRNNIASLLDEMIASKIEEAQESEVYTSKDLADLLQLAHRMRMDERKMQLEEDKITTNIGHQTNVQINDGSVFGSGKYGALMEKLMQGGE